MAGSLGTIVGIMQRKSGQTVAGLIQGHLGTNITQATISSISWTVYRQDTTGDTQTGTGTLTVSAVVFDVPVANDPRYPLAGGFNFLALLPASAFQVGGLRHRIEVTFTPVSGEAFTQLWAGMVQ